MTKKTEGGKNHLEREFYSVSETRTSQGYDSEKEGKGDGKKKVRANRKKFRAEKRVAIMGALLVLTTMLCWTPYALHHSKYLGLPEGHWFGVFTMWLGYCNALLDPLIYSFMNYRVRKEIKSFFRSACAVCHRRSNLHDKHSN
ncbi:melanocortin receptor 5-like [Strongylocentrotus purpuratus]|uniref:G-protein coupled receptors family 1 profile domain-containing protein n=1 Tax=Strongylocentrotus purpuratus TaxID=7668 RepID=A0A7M7PHZ2_STRPU|nr:melanocortin receptor 5-like [Strongylocentrotus purpuratus]